MPNPVPRQYRSLHLSACETLLPLRIHNRLHVITHGSTEKGEWPPLELLLDSTAALNSGSIIDFDFAIVLTAAFSFPVTFTSRLSTLTWLSLPTELHFITHGSTEKGEWPPLELLLDSTAALNSGSSSTFQCLDLHPTTCATSYEAAFLSSACTIGAVSAASASLCWSSRHPPFEKKL